MLTVPRVFVAAMLAFGFRQAAAQEPVAPKLTIDAVTLTILIKSAVMALQHANMTGNYSVLRDLGTPVFREAFDQARLTQAFASLRARNIDLSPALVLSPNLTKTPQLNQNNELVLSGDFPARPLRFHFELAFYRVDGAWRLAGLAVDALPLGAANAYSLEIDVEPRVTMVAKTSLLRRTN